MREYIALDIHKRYSQAEREDFATGVCRQRKVMHERGVITRYLRDAEPGTPVAVEATGNWYWIVEEIEQADLIPQLVHPRKAKLMLGMINKTDKLDVHGLNRLQRTGTLPTVWIPPGPLRDQRELTRTRMVLAAMRTRLKNRIHATLNKYGLDEIEHSDPFGVGGRKEIQERLKRLPPETAYVTQSLLTELDGIEARIEGIETRLKQIVTTTPAIELLQTLPGVGLILATVMALEIGDVHRFASAERLAGYSGTVPRIHASGGMVRFGRLRSDVNRYLKWAFIEAANCVNLHRRIYKDRHVGRLYHRVFARKGHPKAIGAAARHLSEAAFYVLSKQEAYREPGLRTGYSTGT